MVEEKAEERVEQLLCMERAEPKRRILVSDGALYATLLLAVIAVITLGNALSRRFDWPQAVVQVSLYALLLALGWLVYRYGLVSFRYTLTEHALYIERVIGKRIKAEAHISLEDIECIRPCREAYDNGTGKGLPLYTGRRRDAWLLHVQGRGREPGGAFILSPSDNFTGKLINQWKSLQK